MRIDPIAFGIVPFHTSADVMAMAIMPSVPVRAVPVIAIFFSSMMVRADIIGDV